MEIFRGGVDAVMAGIGLYVGERSTVQVDVMSDPGVTDRMGRELPHFSRILDKSILLCHSAPLPMITMIKSRSWTNSQVGV